jgi:hypothetical protein
MSAADPGTANAVAEPGPIASQRRRTEASVLCREYRRHLGVPELASTDYEADDLIGTLVARVRADGLRVTLVTRDRICSWTVPVTASGTTPTRPNTATGIAARFGVAPESMADNGRSRATRWTTFWCPASARRPPPHCWPLRDAGIGYED